MLQDTIDRRLCELATEMALTLSGKEQDRINTKMYRLLVQNDLPLRYVPDRCANHDH